MTAFGADNNVAGQTTTVATPPNEAQIGDYTIQDLDAGTYTVVAEAEGYQTAQQVIDVPLGGTRDVVFNLQPDPVEPDPGAIAGTVTDADTGDPIAGATVSTDGQTATTDANGDYQIDGLDAGDYTVTADAEGYQQASQTVTVADGATTTADFALEPVDPGEQDDPETRRDCFDDGWRDYGFRNQGQCVRFVNRCRSPRGRRGEAGCAIHAGRVSPHLLRGAEKHAPRSGRVGF